MRGCIEPPKGNGDNCAKKSPRWGCAGAFWLLLDGVGLGVSPGNKLCSRFWCPPVPSCPWGGHELCRWVSRWLPLCPGTSTPSHLSPFPPSTVTSEQIEHLHRRFKQLSRDQLTIRYVHCRGDAGTAGGSAETPGCPRCKDERVLPGHPAAALSCLSAMPHCR